MFGGGGYEVLSYHSGLRVYKTHRRACVQQECVQGLYFFPFL